MKAYDSNEDLFGAYIVIHYFEIAYEIMNRSAVDTELSNTIEYIDYKVKISCR